MLEIKPKEGFEAGPGDHSRLNNSIQLCSQCVCLDLYMWNNVWPWGRSEMTKEYILAGQDWTTESFVRE